MFVTLNPKYLGILLFCMFAVAMSLVGWHREVACAQLPPIHATQATARPPFDPLRGAYVLLVIFVLTLAGNSVLLFVGCAMLHSADICAKGGGLAQLGMEVLTAVAVLVAAGKR